MRRLLPVAVAALACTSQSVPPARDSAAADSAETRGAMGAVAGVARADAGPDDRSARMLPFAPPSGDVEILLGDPDAEGKPFVMRIKELPGTVIPPHSHPVDEYLTVLRGTFHFGFGEEFDSTKTRALEPGSFAYMPAGTSMFGYTTEVAVVQVHGTGPFHIRWRHGLTTFDDSAAAATFTFRRGDAVQTPRGPGRIRHGYASGTLVQYDVEAPDGSHFMVHQRDVRRR